MANKKRKPLSLETVKGFIAYYKTEKDFRADLERFEPLLVEMWGEKKYKKFIEDMRGWHGAKSGVGTKFETGGGQGSILRHHLRKHYEGDKRKLDLIEEYRSRKIGSANTPWKYYYQNDDNKEYTYKNINKAYDVQMREVQNLSNQYATIKDFHADIERYKDELKQLWGTERFNKLVLEADKKIRDKPHKDYVAPKVSPMYSYLTKHKPELRGTLDKKRAIKVGSQGNGWTYFKQHAKDMSERRPTDHTDPLQKQLTEQRKQTPNITTAGGYNITAMLEGKGAEKFPDQDSETANAVNAFSEGFIEGAAYNTNLIDSEEYSNKKAEIVGRYVGNVAREIGIAYASAGTVNAATDALAGIPWLANLIARGGATANLMTQIAPKASNIIAKSGAALIRGYAIGQVKSGIDYALNPNRKDMTLKEVNKTAAMWGSGDMAREIATQVLETIAPKTAPGLVNLIGYVADTLGSTLASIPLSEDGTDVKELLKTMISPQVIAMGVVDTLAFGIQNKLIKAKGAAGKKGYDQQLEYIDHYINQYEATGDAQHLNSAFAIMEKMWNDSTIDGVVDSATMGDVFIARVKDKISADRFGAVDTEMVKSVQKVLAGLGYDTPIDGVRSDKFNKSLSAFQRKHGLEETPDIIFSNIADVLEQAQGAKNQGKWTPPSTDELGLIARQPLKSDTDWGKQPYNHHVRNYVKNTIADLEVQKQQATKAQDIKRVQEIDNDIEDLKGFGAPPAAPPKVIHQAAPKVEQQPWDLQLFAKDDNPDEIDENKVALRLLQDMRQEGITTGNKAFIDYVDKQIGKLNTQLTPPATPPEQPQPLLKQDLIDDAGGPQGAKQSPPEDDAEGPNKARPSSAAVSDIGAQSPPGDGPTDIPPTDPNDPLWDDILPYDDDPTVDYLDDDLIGDYPPDDGDYDVTTEPPEKLKPLGLGGEDGDKVKVNIPEREDLAFPPTDLPKDVAEVTAEFDKGSTNKQVFEYRNVHKPDGDGHRTNTTKLDAEVDILRTMDFIHGAGKLAFKMNMNRMKQEALSGPQKAEDVLAEQEALKPILEKLPHAFARARNMYMYLGNQVIMEAVRLNDNPTTATDEDLARYAASKAQLLTLNGVFNRNNVSNVARTLGAQRLSMGGIAYDGRPSKNLKAFDKPNKPRITPEDVDRTLQLLGGRKKVLKDIKETAKYLDKTRDEFLKDIGFDGSKPKRSLVGKPFPLTLALLEVKMAGLLGSLTAIRNEASQAANELYETWLKSPLSWVTDKVFLWGKAGITIDEVVGRMSGSLTGMWCDVFGSVFPQIDNPVRVTASKYNKLFGDNGTLKISSVLDVLGMLMFNPTKALYTLENVIEKTTSESKFSTDKAHVKGVSSENLKDSTTGKALTLAANILNAPFQSSLSRFIPGGRLPGLEIGLNYDPSRTPLANYMWYFIDTIGSLNRLKGFGPLNVNDRKYYSAGYYGELGGTLGRLKHNMPYKDTKLKILQNGDHVHKFQDEVRRKVLALNTIEQIMPSLEAYVLSKNPDNPDKLKTELLDKATDGLYSEIRDTDTKVQGEIEEYQEILKQTQEVITGKRDIKDFYFEHPETGVQLEPAEALEYVKGRLEVLNNTNLDNLKDVPELTSQFLELIHKRCVDTAEDRTFKSKLDFKIYKDIENTMQNNPEVRLLVMPYVHAPLKIAEKAQYETPVAQVLHTKWREDITSKDPVKVNKAIVSSVAGTILFYLVTELYKSGRLTSFASNAQERMRMRLAGIPEHSVQLFNRWYDYSGLDYVVGNFLSLGSTVMKTLEQIDKDEDTDKIVASVIMAYAFSSFEKPWMQGISRFFDLARGRINPNFLGEELNSFFPLASERKLTNKGGLVGNPSTDVIMETQGWLEGFNKTNRPKLDLFGKEQPVERHVLGYRYKKDVDHLTSPIRNEMVRLKMSLPEQTDVPLNLKNPLSPELYHELVSRLDTNYRAEDKLNEFILSGAYERLVNDEVRRDALKDIWRGIKKANVSSFLKENAEFRALVDQARQEQYEKATTRQGIAYDELESWQKSFLGLEE
mgnify:CR=1 FL=1